MVGMIVVGGVLALLAIEGWILIHTRAQEQRLSARLDRLASRQTMPPNDGVKQPGPLDALAGKRAPGFAMTELGGGRLTLAGLLAPAKPLLLIFTDPHCGPCYELLPDIAGWQRVYGTRLSIALVSTGDPGTNRAMTAEYGIRPVLMQRELESVKTYQLAQAPAAVLIQPNGQISAGPRYGVHAVRQLVADTLGLMLPLPPARESRAVGIGDAAPSLRRPDLDGNTVDLTAFRGAPLLLLFWSPGCEHCRALLPEVLAFERRPNAPPIVVVSRGPIGLNRELGLASPIVLDDERAIAGMFGVVGTPAAVLIDGVGKVAAPVVRGTSGVRAILTPSGVSAPMITTSSAG